MQQWQYCAVASIRGLFGHRETYIVALGTDAQRRQKVKPQKGENQETAYLRTIAELGAHGWELVGTEVWVGRYRYLLFKRQVPDGAQQSA